MPCGHTTGELDGPKLTRIAAAQIQRLRTGGVLASQGNRDGESRRIIIGVTRPLQAVLEPFSVPHVRAPAWLAARNDRASNQADRCTTL